jgi:hypothetical protein
MTIDDTIKSLYKFLDKIRDKYISPFFSFILLESAMSYCYSSRTHCFHIVLLMRGMALLFIEILRRTKEQVLSVFVGPDRDSNPRPVACGGYTK